MLDDFYSKMEVFSLKLRFQKIGHFFKIEKYGEGKYFLEDTDEQGVKDSLGEYKTLEEAHERLIDYLTGKHPSDFKDVKELQKYIEERL